MIAFSCSHCGMKLKVKPEFAGRSSKCPTCKQPLVVPAPDKTAGRRRSRRRSTAPTAAWPKRASMAASPWNQVPPLVPVSSRCRNCWPGRTKNGRTLRHRGRDRPRRHGGGPAGRRLRHPPGSRRQVPARPGRPRQEGSASSRRPRSPASSNIPTSCPIHELGVDAQKRLFFSMKMVKGRSLAAGAGRAAAEPEDRPRRNSRWAGC